MKKEFKFLRGTVGDFVKKTMVVLLSCYGFGLSMAITIKAGAGVDPITLMMEGATKFFGLNFTVVNWVVSIICITLMLVFNRRGIYIATVIMMLLIGAFCDLNNWIIAQIYPADITFYPLQLLLALVGFVILGVSIGSYLPMEMGAAPTDGVVQIIHRGLSSKFKGFKYSYAMWILYIVAFVIGVILGGTWGVGTLIGLILPGYLCNLVMPFFRKTWPKVLRFDQKSIEMK